MYTGKDYYRELQGTGQVTLDNDRKETILLVEDDPALLKLVHRMLEGLNYQVLAARSPDRAVDLSGQHPGEIHLLLTDIVLPGLNGTKLAALLQSSQPNLKRLFMSGYSESILRQKGVDVNDKILEKPFTKTLLAASIREILEGEPGGDPQI